MKKLDQNTLAWFVCLVIAEVIAQQLYLNRIPDDVHNAAVNLGLLLAGQSTIFGIRRISKGYGLDRTFLIGLASVGSGFGALVLLANADSPAASPVVHDLYMAGVVVLWICAESGFRFFAGRDASPDRQLENAEQE